MRKIYDLYLKFLFLFDLESEDDLKKKIVWKLCDVSLCF